jgi:hypothetical protein
MLGCCGLCRRVEYGGDVYLRVIELVDLNDRDRRRDEDGVRCQTSDDDF